MNAVIAAFGNRRPMSGRLYPRAAAAFRRLKTIFLARCLNRSIAT